MVPSRISSFPFSRLLSTSAQRPVSMSSPRDPPQIVTRRSRGRSREERPSQEERAGGGVERGAYRKKKRDVAECGGKEEAEEAKVTGMGRPMHHNLVSSNLLLPLPGFFFLHRAAFF